MAVALTAALAVGVYVSLRAWSASHAKGLAEGKATGQVAHRRRIAPLEAGDRRRYAFAWTAESSASLGGDGAPDSQPKKDNDSDRAKDPAKAPSLDGFGRLGGTLELTGLGMHDGVRVVTMVLKTLAQHSLQIAGAELLSDEATVRSMLNVPVYVRLDSRGAVVDYGFESSAPELARSLFPRIFDQIALCRAGSDDAESWSCPQRAPHGAAFVKYMYVDDDTIERRRVRYDAFSDAPACDGCAQSVDDLTTVTLDLAGLIQRLEVDGRVGLKAANPAALDVYSARDTLSLTLESAERLALAMVPPLPDQLESRPAAPALTAAEIESQLAAQRTGDLTLPALFDTVVAASQPNSRLPAGFIARASALLEQDPEACNEVVRRFNEGRLSLRTRVLLTDLLASAGSPEAQEALRTVLSSPAARSTKELYPTLVQRLGFVDRPDAQTIAYAEQAYTSAVRKGSVTERSALAYTLGATASNLAREGRDPQDAKRLTDTLRKGLRAARDSEGKRAYLSGLGNAGAPEDVSLVGMYVSDGDEGVRFDAIHALRHARGEEASTYALRAMSDASMAVQQEAVRVYGDVSSTEPQALQRLADVVERGAIAEGTYGELLNTLATHGGDLAATHRILGFIVAHATDPVLRARANEMLQR